MLLRAKKRYSYFAALLMILTLALSACGGGGATTSSGPTQVVWWSWNPGPPFSTQLVNAFNTSHHNIKLVYKNEQYADYINNLKLAMASGTGPDIFGVQAGAMQIVYSPFMENLTPYSQKAWGNDWKSRFYSFGLDPMVSGDTTRALPLYVSAAGYLWYNKTILDKYGLQPPKTFNEWVTLSNTLTSKGVTPFVQGAKDAWVDYDMYIALANGVAPGKFYQAEAGKLSWTDPDLVKAMSYWQQMFHNGIMQKGALGASQYPDANNLFSEGKAAMILMGTWNDGAMTKSALASNASTLGVKTNYEFLPINFPSLDGSGQPGRPFGGPDTAVAINKASSVKDAAWQVLQWLTSQQAQQMYGQQLSQPSVKGYNIDNSDVYTAEQKTVLQTQEQDLANNVIGPREINYPDLQTALSDALQSVATGSQTPAQAMAAVQQASANIQR